MFRRPLGGGPARRFPAVLLGGLTWTLLAAHEPGTLTGQVKDSGGRPVARAIIEVSGPGLQAPRKATSDSAGGFTVSDLPKGTFQVTVRHPGFLTALRRFSTESAHAVGLQITLHPYSATVEVTAKADITHRSDLDAPVNHLLGIADTASEGIVTPQKLDERGYMRVGEVLETVPGLLISQHSGEGKANQYYLRGFDLDHGTDMSTSVAGMPVNLPTNAHGQGYSDLSFLIPELVSNIQYEKGPYYAQDGDFSAAGSVHVNYVHSLDQTLAKVELGQEGYRRFLAAGSMKVGDGDLLGAFELFHNNGPWVNPDDYRKYNALLRYSGAGPKDVLELTFMAYSGRWNSTDQVPERAIVSGAMSRWGAVDPTDGGDSHRESLVASWVHKEETTQTELVGFASSYAMNLFSNFTYYLVDPVHGDQVEQADRRVTTGLKATERWSGTLFGQPTDTEAGFQFRNDNIPSVGLYHTQARAVLGTYQRDQVTETSEAFYLQNKLQWTPVVRTMVGVREDLYQIGVIANLPANSGQTNASMTSPKASIIFGPYHDTEFYLSYGQGFHSNDARGTTLTVDPMTGNPQAKVTTLVRATGYEAGLRTSIIPAWQSTLAVFRLDLGSELVFDADDGTTGPSGPTRRVGVEWNNEIHATDRLTLTADGAMTHARYTDFEPLGDFVPEAINGVAILGINWKATERLDLSVLHRYFGPRNLTQDGTVHSHSSDLTQFQVRWRPTRRLTFTADIFNVFNRKTSDIDYYYISRLQGEPAEGVAGIVTHPVEPMQVRMGLQLRF
jgi:hypothetical protein